MASVLPSSSADLEKRKAWLDYSTVLWNVGAAVAAVSAGALFDSISLSVFGLESLIQTFIAVSFLVGVYCGTIKGKSPEAKPVVDRRLQFALGILFFLLALYILNESGSRLFYREKPQNNSVALILSILTIVVMSALAFFKFRTAKALASAALIGEAKENVMRVYLSLLLLIGFWLQTVRGWWWADALAALFMLPYILRQGWKIIEESKSPAVKSQTVRMLF